MEESLPADYPFSNPEDEMKYSAYSIVLLLLPASLSATDLLSYGGSTYGASIKSTVEQKGVPTKDALVIHRRPALLQKFKWQISPQVPTISARPDRVENIALSLLDGKLYKIWALFADFRL